MKIYGREDITLKNGVLYKLKESPNWNNEYTIVCPKSSVVIRRGQIRSWRACIFKIKGRGKTRGLERNSVFEVSNGHSTYNNSNVKPLSPSDYFIVNRTLKKNGYMYDKKNKKLIKIKNEARKK